MQGRPNPLNAGVVQRTINPAISSHALRNEFIDALLISNISMHENRVTTTLADLTCDLYSVGFINI